MDFSSLLSLWMVLLLLLLLMSWWPRSAALESVREVQGYHSRMDRMVALGNLEGLAGLARQRGCAPVDGASVSVGVGVQTGSTDWS